MAYLKRMGADWLQIFREPILLLLVLLPAALFFLCKIIFQAAAVLLLAKFNFRLADYTSYAEAVVYLMTPSMLGTVAGFLMIDDRDARIVPLMAVTPSGIMGYMVNRLAMPFVLGVVYTWMGSFVFDVSDLDWLQRIAAALFCGAEGMIIALFLFLLSDNKVQGLTVSKGINTLNLFCLANLLKQPVLIGIAACFPQYWIYAVVVQMNLKTGLIAAGVHLIWLALLLKTAERRMRMIE